MKYICIVLFYIVIVLWHLIDIVFRTVVNFFIFTWDFKIKDKKFYSYRTVFLPEHVGSTQVPIADYYSVKKQLG